MSFVVPNVVEVEVITERLTPAHTLKLYGNDITPGENNLAAQFTEIAGGGYVAKPILFANWTITGGSPSQAVYTAQTWIFTGVITAPGTIYGYFITRNSDGKLLLAERFPSASVPFSPVTGSKIVLLPTFSCESQF
jgi:hypothetical protein